MIIFVRAFMFTLIAFAIGALIVLILTHSRITLG
jgi:hypothetical protein